MSKYLDIDGLKYVIGKLKDGSLKAGKATNADSASAVAWTNVTNKPNTISGYGITDAKIENGAITLGGNKITPLQTSARGAANGVAPLEADGIIAARYLPSYVDDIIEGYYSNGKFYSDSSLTTEIPTAEKGEGGAKVTGKIYVDITDGADSKIYRYSGSTYVPISDVPADVLNRIKALETAQSDIAKKTGVTSIKIGTNDPESGAVTITASKLGLGNVQNTADSAKSVAKAAQLTTARTIAISGAVTGTATSFNGTANITIPTTSVDVSKLSGAVAVAKGGTGATDVAGAQKSLGIITADATTTAHGLMSTDAVTKLNGIAANATADTSISTADINGIL